MDNSDKGLEWRIWIFWGLGFRVENSDFLGMLVAMVHFGSVDLVRGAG